MEGQASLFIYRMAIWLGFVNRSVELQTWVHEKDILAAVVLGMDAIVSEFRFRNVFPQSLCLLIIYISS